MDNRFLSRVRASAVRIPTPLSTYPGLPLTGARVLDVLSDPRVQVETQLALHERFETPLLLSPMDLSAEAEAFGSEIRFSDGEVPSVVRPLVESAGDVRQLAIPAPGDGRTAVHLEAVAMMRRAEPDAPIVGGIIGPFSLAGQLLGLTPLMMLSLSDPGLVEALLDKTTPFLARYAAAFAAAGADAVLMAEPMAGLISPALLGRFSSARVAAIREAAEAGGFRVFLHNCSARLVHLPKILEAGASFYHFGAPMDLAAALKQVPADVVVAGNLDPARVFCQGTAETVAAAARALLAAADGQRCFVPSSGCDLPPGTPLDNLEAFYRAVRDGADGPPPAS
ncbi:MAG: Uroporphyrinogen-III decarboxylase [Acidobacteria bacterium]|nr:Uroporphyrinogen-III decarboxylase [Acidobacteriota bacterium]